MQATPKPERPTLINVTVERLKNWRRVNPMVSASGGVQGAGAADRAGSRAVERSATAARSISRPVTEGSSTAAGTARRSRRRVSRDSEPAPRRTSPRRAAVTKAMAARTTTAAMTMAITAVELICGTSEIEEDAVAPREGEVETRAAEERADDHEHGPEHEEDGEESDGELPVLRLVARIAIDIRRQHEGEQAHAGDGHARHHRVEHGEQLLEPQEVPGRLGRVRRAVDVGQLQQRRVHEDGEDEGE